MRVDWEFRLVLVTPPRFASLSALEETIRLAIRGGVTAVQLRMKEQSAREFVEAGLRLKSILMPLTIPLIINDRVDIALACDADGVHLGQSDMPYRHARRLLGKHRRIGLSVENLEQALEAETLDADYLGVSPVFSTATKSDLGPPWGLDGLRRLRLATSRPLVAIGGIGQDNVKEVLAAGADGVAVVSAIFDHPSPDRAASRLKEFI